MIRRVLVTGGQGLLGRHVVEAMLAGGATAVLAVGRSPRDDDHYTHDLRWLDRRLHAPVPARLRGCARDRRFGYVSLDVRDEEAVAKLASGFGPDVVVHTAAALRDAPWPALLESNLQATVGLLRGLAKSTPCRVVMTSSGSVYGLGGGVLPFSEDGPAQPIELYGATKRTSEDVARILASEHGLALVQARVFNMVGPGLQDQHLPAILAGRLAAIARGLAEPVMRIGPLDATRDFVDVRDVAEALRLIADSHTAPSVVNVGSGVETPVRAVLETLRHLSGVPELRLDAVVGRRADVPRACADVSRLTALGFVAGHTLPDSLAGMLAYFDAFPAR
jgi:nucleoside-diphosphate-sugar epimerase